MAGNIEDKEIFQELPEIFQNSCLKVWGEAVLREWGNTPLPLLSAILVLFP